MYKYDYQEISKISASISSKQRVKHKYRTNLLLHQPHIKVIQENPLTQLLNQKIILQKSQSFPLKRTKL